MKIVVISDIHGNCVALDAVLEDLKRYPAEYVVCLGDAVQGGPQPAQVVARLRQLACPVVIGNADAWLLIGKDSGREEIPPERMQKMLAVREWSLSHLSDEDKEFIADFQPTVEIPLTTDRRLLCFHGSPGSFDDVILPQTPEEEFQKYLGSYTGHILTGGHTHLQQVRRIGTSFFFNPGSVGFSYNPLQDSNHTRADPWAEYALFNVDESRMSLEFRRIPFDVAELRRVYIASGRPYAEEAIAQYTS